MSCGVQTFWAWDGASISHTGSLGLDENHPANLASGWLGLWRFFVADAELNFHQSNLANDLHSRRKTLQLPVLRRSRWRVPQA